MPTTNKPARHIVKLTEALHAKDAEIARLQRELTAAREREAERTIAMAGAERAQHEERSRADRLRDRLADLDRLNVAATRALEDLETKYQATTTALRSSEVMRLAAVDALNAMAARMAELAPQITLVETQRIELTNILDGVRDRMRRKEIEAEAAILNRKAVAAVVPGRNFR